MNRTLAKRNTRAGRPCHYAWGIALFFCVIGSTVFAQKHLEFTPPIILSPEQAVKEGRALVDEMLSLKPEENTTTGVMSIRTKKNYTKISIKFQTTVTPTNWLNDYQAVYSNRVEHILIFHNSGETNRYSQFGSDRAGNENKIQVASLTPVKDIWAPFAGSDFSIADLGLEFLHWPDQRLLQKEPKRSRSCRVLESINPHPVPGGYSRVKSWIDAESDGIVQAMAYDVNGKELKQFFPKDFSKGENGQWRLEEMQISNSQTGSSSTVKFNVGH